MSLSIIYQKLLANLLFFRIEDSLIDPRCLIIVRETVTRLDQVDDDIRINIGALRQRAWDLIHTGKWSDVAEGDKYLYSLATYLEVLVEFQEHLMAVEEQINLNQSLFFLEHSLESLDMAILLGCPILDNAGDNVFCSAATLISRCLTDTVGPAAFPEILIDLPDDQKTLNYCKTEIPIENAANLIDSTKFNTAYYDKQRPVLITNNIINWPAVDKWRDVSYFQRSFGYRTVPVEVGSQYTTEDWGQELMLFKDFIQSQFGEIKTGPVHYLAQHDLFQQCPELTGDIKRPVLLDQLDLITPLERKIWFGPKGTVSPLHFDKKENFLCQVVGWKRIVLIPPEDTAFVYPFEGQMMSNTSQLDLTTEIDEKRFPLAKQARRLQVLLGPEQTLFIPYGWWHHVTSLTPSISVSFWWNR